MVKTRRQIEQEQKYLQDFVFARPTDDEVRLLQKEFKTCKPLKIGRKAKEKQQLTRRKITAQMVERIYGLHQNLGYSFKKIGLMMHVAPTTAYTAWKRFKKHNNKHLDLRKFNGRNNRRQKILPNISRYLLDPQVLQRWANFCLQ